MIYFQSNPEDNQYTFVSENKSSQAFSIDIYRSNQSNKEVIFYCFRSQLLHPNIIKKVSQEFDTFCNLKSIDTKKILKFQQAYFDKDKVNSYIYLRAYEKQQFSTYYEQISTGAFLEDKNKIGFMLQIMQPLNYLHQNGISHGNITAENIFYHKIENFYLLGLPKFYHLNKLLRKRNKIRQMNKRIQSPQQLKGLSYTKQSDVWHLGLLLLSFFIKINKKLQLQLENTEQYENNLSYVLNNVQNTHLRYLLELMLKKNKQTRITIDQCLNIVNKIVNKQKLSLNILKIKNQHIHYLQLKCFNIDPTFQSKFQPSQITQSKARILNESLKLYLMQQKIILQIKKQETLLFFQFFHKKIKRQIQIYNDKDYQLFFLEMDFKITLEIDGILRLYYDIQKFYQKKFSKKQKLFRDIMKNSEIKDRIVQIQSSNEKFSGIILHDNIMLLPITATHDKQKKPKQNVRISYYFEYRNCPEIMQQGQYFIGKAENIHKYNISVARMNCQKVTEKYLVFIKDFQQNLLLDKLSQYEEKDVQFCYFIDDYLFKMDEIDFNYRKKSFIIKNIDKDVKLKCGSPLCLVLSNNKTFVLGIYQGKEKGNLFNEQISFIIFQCYKFRFNTEENKKLNQNVYKSTQQYENRYSDALLKISFAFSQFQNIFFDDADMISISQTYCISYKSNLGLTGPSQVKSYLDVIKEGKNDHYNIAMLNYLLSLLQIQNTKKKIFYLSESINHFQLHYKRDNMIIIILKLVKEIHIKDKQMSKGKRVSNLQLKNLVKRLQTYYYHPLLLCTCYSSLVNFSLSIQQLHYIELNLLSFYKLKSHEVFKVYLQALVQSDGLRTQQNLQHKYYSSQLIQFTQNSNSFFNFKLLSIPELIKKINKLKKLRLFNEALLYLRRLFIVNENTYGCDVIIMHQIVHAWKQMVIDLIKYSKFQRQIETFQKISKEYYREGYLHLKYAFQKKKIIVKKQEKQRQQQLHATL